MYVNDARFDVTKFGEESIEKFSTLKFTQIDPYIPQWVEMPL